MTSNRSKHRHAQDYKQGQGKPPYALGVKMWWSWVTSDTERSNMGEHTHGMRQGRQRGDKGGRSETSKDKGRQERYTIFDMGSIATREHGLSQNGPARNTKRHSTTRRDVQAWKRTNGDNDNDEHQDVKRKSKQEEEGQRSNNQKHRYTKYYKQGQWEPPNDSWGKMW